MKAIRQSAAVKIERVDSGDHAAQQTAPVIMPNGCQSALASRQEHLRLEVKWCRDEGWGTLKLRFVFPGEGSGANRDWLRIRVVNGGPIQLFEGTP